MLQYIDGVVGEGGFIEIDWLAKGSGNSGLDT